MIDLTTQTRKTPKFWDHRSRILLAFVLLGVCAVLAMVQGGRLSAFASTDAPLKNLQKLIDKAKKGDVITPPPGAYKGPVTITKAITLDGRNKVVIDAGGKGSVIYLNTNNAILKNLHLTNTGAQHNDLDAGIQVRGNFNIIQNNRITESLFGIDLQQSSNNVVRRNFISSISDSSLGIRGDAIRLWYSRNNRIEKNKIRNSRDIVVWYSADNIIADNDIAFGRYGLHFMYSKYNLVEKQQHFQKCRGHLPDVFR